MKRRHLFESAAAAGRGSVAEVTKAAAALAALLLGLFGIGRTATAQAQSMESTTSAPAASRGQGNGPVWLRIMAFTDAPVSGADVRVSVHGSQGRRLVDVHAATNKYGVLPVQVPSHSSSFRVEISGGTTNGDPFLGHLMADIALADPAHQIVVVNPVTTLVSLVLDKRPNLKLVGAQARVRRFLTLPVNYPLGLALRQGSRYTSRFFSPVAFLTELRDAGGLDAFEHLLLQELAADSTHSFRKPKLLGDTTSTATSVVETGLEAGVLDYAGANNVANLTGWAMSLTGLTGGSSSDIDALVDALVELQSEIENLAYEVSQLTNLVQSSATQEELNTIVTPAQALATQVNGVENQLSYFAQDCPPLPVGSTPTTPDEYCRNEKASINSELNSLTIQQGYGVMEGYVGDNSAAGIRGILHLSSLYLAQTRPAFFRAADSTQMQNLYNYWDAALTQAMNLYIELQHELGAQDNPGAQQMLINLMGNPDLNPPTTGTFQANQAANLKLIGRAVPAGTVVSTVNQTMWSLLPWQPCIWGGCPRGPEAGPAGTYSKYGYWLAPAQGEEGNAGESCWTQTTGQLTAMVGGTYYNALVLPQYGIDSWQWAPTKSDWEAAVQNAPPGTDWQTWLIDQTQTTGDETPASNGFFKLNSCSIQGAWAPVNADIYESGAVWWVILDHGQSNILQVTQSSDTFLLWPVHYLQQGEFYFWSN